jgi:hypothetical protein
MDLVIDHVHGGGERGRLLEGIHDEKGAVEILSANNKATGACADSASGGQGKAVSEFHDGAVHGLETLRTRGCPKSFKIEAA